MLRNQLLLIASSLGYDISYYKSISPKSYIINGHKGMSKILYGGSYYYKTRTTNSRWSKCLSVNKENVKNQRSYDKLGRFVSSGFYKTKKFEFKSKSIKSIKHKPQNQIFYDLSVENELFLIEGGIVSHNSFNWGSAHMVGKQLPVGGFNPGNSRPSQSDFRTGRWEKGKANYAPIVTKPIPATNFLENTVNWLHYKVLQLLGGIK